MCLDEKCIFCRIIRGEIPSTKVYEDDVMVAFKDVNPRAKVHILAIPKDHYKLIEDVPGNAEREAEVMHILGKVPEIARDNGCGTGYRLVVNQGEDAGQTVFHLHFHILGGETLGW